MAYNPYWVV